MQLDELRDAYLTLEQSLTGDDKSYKQKLQVLERSNAEISQMYQAAINEKSILKVNLQVADRKMQKTVQRQTLLEKKYEANKVKN